MNYLNLLDTIRSLFDWENEEAENKRVTRFDYATEDRQAASLWVYESGTLDGSAPKAIQQAMSKLDKGNYLKYH